MRKLLLTLGFPDDRIIVEDSWGQQHRPERPVLGAVGSASRHHGHHPGDVDHPSGPGRRRLCRRGWQPALDRELPGWEGPGRQHRSVRPRRHQSVRQHRLSGRVATDAALDAGPARELSVDLYRVIAIAFVVLGHWLVSAVTYSDGRFGNDYPNAGRDALDPLADTAVPGGPGLLPGRRLCQRDVVGALARDRRSPLDGLGPPPAGRHPGPDHRVRGARTYGGRGARPPRRRAVGAVVRWVGGGHASVVRTRVPGRGGADPRRDGRPPTMGCCWCRQGTDALAVAAVDVAARVTGVAGIAAVNYVLCWSAIYQLGICWRAGPRFRAGDGCWCR